MSATAKRTDLGPVVLAAVDLGGDWTNVVAHAAAFARRERAGLHLVHVLEEPPGAVRRALSGRELTAWNERHQEEAERRLARARAAAGARGDRLEVTAASIAGRPAPVILEEARRRKAGLVVCGAGVTERSEWLLVRTTPDRLLRVSAVPVLVVGPDAARRFRRVLVPTDFDRADQGALRTAARIAREDGARVSVIHAYALPSLNRGYSGDVASLRSLIREDVRGRFGAFLSATRLPRGPAPPHRLLRESTESVSAAESIVGEAARLHMDLIVMALGRGTVLRRIFLGSRR